MNTRAGALLACFEQQELAVKHLPNKVALKLLKDIYLSGKNKSNPNARWVDTSRGDDFVTFDIELARLNQGRNAPVNGILDDTVNVDYAKTLIGKSLPPLLINRNLSVIDGGHRYYAAYHGNQKTVPVIMRRSFFDQARKKGLL